jgi:quercetin dioxygenase-like cupin family protein
MGERATEPVVLEARQVEAVPVRRARGARMAVLIGPDEGAPRFIMRRFLLAVGGKIPTHRHDTIEHEQVVVRGEMTIGLNDATHTVRPGDAIYIPAGTSHWYENRGSEEVEFLCAVPYTSDYETEWLEEPPDGAEPAEA